jgi:nucleotide-binding universal stress UspA family protein
MKRFKNILMLYNQSVGDDAALDRATALAKRNGARLTVLEVIERMPSLAAAPFGSSVTEQRDLHGRYFDERRALIERLVDPLRQEGVEVDGAVAQGKVFLAIVRAVLRDGFDLVVMTADSLRGLRSITFGSNSMHVMRKCPCPVWVMKPKAERRFHRILAAVDPGPSDAPLNSLDVKILEMASSLARMEDCHLDIANAWDYIGTDLDTSRSEIDDTIRDRLVNVNMAERKAAVDRLLGKVDLDGLSFDVHLPRGNPSLLIPELVAEHAVDLIVMGTATRSGIAGFLIGTTAEDVLRQVDCSVLTLKPDGFVSPVALEG